MFFSFFSLWSIYGVYILFYFGIYNNRFLYKFKILKKEIAANFFSVFCSNLNRYIQGSFYK